MSVRLLYEVTCDRCGRCETHETVMEITADSKGPDGWGFVAGTRVMAIALTSPREAVKRPERRALLCQHCIVGFFTWLETKT